jgi:hypothetical protein
MTGFLPEFAILRVMQNGREVMGAVSRSEGKMCPKFWDKKAYLFALVFVIFLFKVDLLYVYPSLGAI